MKPLSYHYRPIHAVAEKLLEVLAPLFRHGTAPPQMPVPRKILVLKFGGMGEAVLARSLVERLRERNSFMSFDFVVEVRTVEAMISGGSGVILEYSPGKDGMGRAIKVLWGAIRGHYDAIMDFEQRSLLTAAFARATSIPMRIGFIPSEPSARGQMFTHPIKLRENESMWSAFIRIGRVLDPGLPEKLMTFPLPCTPESETWFDDWWNDHAGPGRNGRFVAMHLGVGPSAQYRRWPTERFVQVAKNLLNRYQDTTFVLTGAKSEQSIIDGFREQFQGRSIDALDLGGLGHTAVLLRRCDLLISGDTGIMHLAASMGTPTVGLFGPNTPVCWAPIGPRATYVYPTGRACSPCINSYRRSIPEECTAIQEGACMWDIGAHEVVTAARSVIRDSWLGPAEFIHYSPFVIYPGMDQYQPASALDSRL